MGTGVIVILTAVSTVAVQAPKTPTISRSCATDSVPLTGMASTEGVTTYVLYTPAGYRKEQG